MTPTTNGVLFEWVCDALKPSLERGLKKAKLFTLAGYLMIQIYAGSIKFRFRLVSGQVKSECWHLR
jgi:hypothetical protein